MKSIILTAAMILGAQAHADGFVCENLNENLRIKVFHETQPQLGTRNAAIMVVSDPSVSAGRKTIATFSADNALLTNAGSTYTSDVDLRFKGSNRKGENIAGTKLGELDKIILHVNYSFAAPLADGAPVSGEAVLVRRAGDDIRVEMDCTRYLKN
jgi:hypothetical protein